MIQVQGVTINGKKFVVDGQVAITTDGQVIPVEDKPVPGKWGR